MLRLLLVKFWGAFSSTQNRIALLVVAAWIVVALMQSPWRGRTSSPISAATRNIWLASIEADAFLDRALFHRPHTAKLSDIVPDDVGSVSDFMKTRPHGAGRSDIAPDLPPGFALDEVAAELREDGQRNYYRDHPMPYLIATSLMVWVFGLSVEWCIAPLLPKRKSRTVVSMLRFLRDFNANLRRFLFTLTIRGVAVVAFWTSAIMLSAALWWQAGANRYEIVAPRNGDARFVYRLDRRTGQVEVCNYLACTPPAQQK